MIKAKVSTDYKDIERIFAGGAIQKEIIKVWSTEANDYVFEAWKILEMEGPLPLTFNANGEPLIDYRIYGNTSQTGTPTPENPIMPIGCGELEPTGVHAGQYKLPILSNSTVTNIYLGEVRTTRRIKKSVFDGTEDWSGFQEAETRCVARMSLSETDAGINTIIGYCSHLEWKSAYASGDLNRLSFTSPRVIYLSLDSMRLSESSLTAFKSYLAAQYAAGTPVTVWYVLDEPETAVVNEPLMKIGDYADTVDSAQTNAQIPTIAGTNVIDYDGGEKHFITSDGYELVDKNQNGFLLPGSTDSTLYPEKMYIKYKGR